MRLLATSSTGAQYQPGKVIDAKGAVRVREYFETTIGAA